MVLDEHEGSVLGCRGGEGWTNLFGPRYTWILGGQVSGSSSRIA